MEKQNRHVGSLKPSRPCTLVKECKDKGAITESTAGKKRKKKKKTETNDSAATIPPETEPQSSLLPFSNNLNHQTMSPKKEIAGKCNSTLEKRKQYSSPITTATPAGSSSSSLESSKPPSKITRLKKDLQDQTSVIDQLLTNTEIVHETAAIQPSPKETLSDHDREKLRQPNAHEESLRWENQCSDEEKERERIELYKRNRQKRYGKQFRSQQLPQCNPFYTPSESIS